MRLDRFLSVTGTASRANAAKLIRQGAVLVNGTVMKKPDSRRNFCGKYAQNVL